MWSHGLRVSDREEKQVLDVGAAKTKLSINAEQAGRAIVEVKTTMARKNRRYQTGSLLIRGAKRKVYVLRYYEPVLLSGGKVGNTRRSVVLGAVSEIGTKKQAWVVADSILRQLNLGHHRPQSVRTLAEFAKNDWAPTVLPTLKYSTQRYYGYVLDTHILPAIGDRRLCDLTREEVQAFLTAKLKVGLAWETVAHMKHTLSKMLSTAVEWGYSSENVATMVKLPRRVPGPPRAFLTEDQAKKLLAVLDEPGRTIVLTLLLTGCRIGEVLALRWKHVDLNRGVLHIRESVYQGHFGSPKTLSSIGDLPLGPKVVNALSRHRQKQGSEPHPDALVFPNEKGGPHDTHNLLWRVLYPACKTARVPRVSWHGLRHSHATLLNSQGESVKTIQAQLRHSSARVSLEIYTHAVPQHQRDAVERLEQVIGP
jgi:integrase